MNGSTQVGVLRVSNRMAAQWTSCVTPLLTFCRFVDLVDAADPRHLALSGERDGRRRLPLWAIGGALFRVTAK